MIGIYKIVNPSNKIYIGQSVDIEKRWARYKIILCQNQTKLKNSLKKYGFDNHKFSILEECETERLNERERYWQDFYNSLEFGLNCKLTETKDRNGLLSNETRSKISESLKGKKHSNERIEKNKKSNTGKNLSKDSIEKLKKPKGPHKIIECSKCGKSGGSHSMKRYHFDNCGKIKRLEKIECPICQNRIGGVSNFNRHYNYCLNKNNRIINIK